MGSANKPGDEKKRLEESLRLAKAFNRIDDADVRRKILEMAEEAVKKAGSLKSP